MQHRCVLDGERSYSYLGTEPRRAAAADASTCCRVGIRRLPTIGTPMGWFNEFKLEWRARRAGRVHLENNIGRATRDIAGPTGWVVSPTWEAVDKSGDTYVKSFDRRLPPSTFVSERDRLRANMPMPLVERCIEDWGQDRSTAHSPQDLESNPTTEQHNGADPHSH